MSRATRRQTSESQNGLGPRSPAELIWQEGLRPRAGQLTGRQPPLGSCHGLRREKVERPVGSRMRAVAFEREYRDRRRARHDDSSSTTDKGAV